MYPSGSTPARIYGTPKMNKFSSSDSFLKLGTLNYNPDHFLCDLCSPLVPNDYSCKKFLVSYDVTRLFTSIPLQ